MSDLGNVETGDRCANCERMRAAIGTSRVPVPRDASPSVGGLDVAGLAGALTEHERHILEHSTGWRSRWPLYRNHFCAGPSHDDWSAIQGLIARGLMRVSRKPSSLSGGDTVFCVTAIGIAALKEKRAPAASDAASNQPTG